MRRTAGRARSVLNRFQYQLRNSGSVRGFSPLWNQAWMRASSRSRNPVKYVVHQSFARAEVVDKHPGTGLQGFRQGAKGQVCTP